MRRRRCSDLAGSGAAVARPASDAPWGRIRIVEYVAVLWTPPRCWSFPGHGERAVQGTVKLPRVWFLFARPYPRTLRTEGQADAGSRARAWVLTANLVSTTAQGALAQFESGLAGDPVVISVQAGPVARFSPVDRGGSGSACGCAVRVVGGLGGCGLRSRSCTGRGLRRDCTGRGLRRDCVGLRRGRDRRPRDCRARSGSSRLDGSRDQRSGDGSGCCREWLRRRLFRGTRRRRRRRHDCDRLRRAARGDG